MKKINLITVALLFFSSFFSLHVATLQKILRNQV